MSTEEMEVATLAMLHAFDPEEVPLDDLVPEESLEDIAGLDDLRAIERMVHSSDPQDPVERFWLTYALVRGQRAHVDEVPEEVTALAAHLLSPFDLPDVEDSAQAFVRALSLLEPGEPLNDDALGLLQHAFGDALVISGDASVEQVQIGGPAATVVTLAIELATNDLDCQSSIHKIMVNGALKEVVFVEVDACTNRSFASCRSSISPLAWPAANPMFLSVKPIGNITKSGANWAGAVKEKVWGYLTVYETDLAITYVEEPGLAITAFDLADNGTGDGRVTVDRGFLSCTDEGLHRRIRVLKVYRIEDLTMTPYWICKLWALPLAYAAWWSGS